MREWQSQTHVRWYCRYHVVIVPKYRKKTIYGVLRKEIGGVLKDLCGQFGVDLVEGHAMSEHIHLCLSVPPKYSVANTIGFLKGKSAIKIFDHHHELKKRYWGRHFWAKGYFVSTVGLDEKKIRRYVRHQLHKDQQAEQVKLWKD